MGTINPNVAVNMGPYIKKTVYFNMGTPCPYYLHIQPDLMSSLGEFFEDIVVR